MAYRIELRRSAAREIEAIRQKKIRQQVMARIEALARDPRPPGCTKLTGRDAYRVRQGDYRIVYSVRDAALVVEVVKVGRRGDVYR